LFNNLPPTDKRFIRFNPMVKPVNKNHTWNVPEGFTGKEFETLINMDMDAVEQKDVDLIYKLCTEWMNPDGEIENQGIKYNSDLQVIIGHNKYQDAKKEL